MQYHPRDLDVPGLKSVKLATMLKQNIKAMQGKVCAVRQVNFCKHSVVEVTHILW